MAAIEITGLTKTYTVGFWRKRPKCALRPLTFTVEHGEIFGYLGPNGAGKTTTLKLLMGLIFPSAGSARILGKPIDDPSIKAQIGFLPEQPYFYDYLTAIELLTYYAQLSGVPARERRRRVDEVLHRVGLPDSGGTQLRKLSKGMLQRVGIAQAILHDPKVVFLDEPMSGLDPIGRLEVRDLIATLKEESKTVLFSTHILSDAEALCDRVAVLNKGELRGIGSVEELTARTRGRVEVIYQGSRAAALDRLVIESHATGEITRIILAQDCLDAAIDSIGRAGAKLISVNPVRATLEDYFVEKIADPVEAMQ